ncbi:MAG: ABC transporter ATP-binding protein [Patescibacteria group bacterium]
MFKILKRYYQFVFVYKKYFWTFFVCLILASIAQSIHPYFYKQFVDGIPSGNMQFLFQVLLAYIGVRIAGVILSITSSWLGDKALIPVARDIRIAVFKKIQDLDFAFHASKSTGFLISAFKRGDISVFTLYHIINFGIIEIFVNLIVVLFFFSQIDMRAMFLMLIIFVINLFIAKLLIEHNIKARRAFNKEEDRVSEIIVDNMINFETVKLFAKESYELERLEKQFVSWSDRLWGYAKTFRLIDGAVGLIGNLGIFFVLFFGLQKFVAGQITAGDFVMMLTFVAGFYYRFFELTFKLRDLAKHQVDIEKYFESLDFETQVKDPLKPTWLTKVAGQIEFDHVSYSYQEGVKDAVRDIHLTIPANHSLALVGESGVGKSTLVKLLLRFFDPIEGSIKLDGVDIRHMTKSHLRSFMGVVPQDPILFNNTIGYNIAYGSANVTQAQLVEACQLANLYDFIQELPKGFETNVGERGIKLSGGQKQRLAIARTVLSNPKIIIFDEATSQLDSESEKKIQDALWKVAKQRTTIIIAHRLSTVTRADKIVVLKNGQVKEVGTHAQLVDMGELYANFWQLQTSGGPILDE